jgi:hypothetical protein
VYDLKYDKTGLTPSVSGDWKFTVILMLRVAGYFGDFECSNLGRGGGGGGIN